MINYEDDMISSFEVVKKISGDKWKFLIVCNLFDGSKRFGELQYLIAPITKKVLTQNLRELENLGIIFRQEYSDIIPKVEYSLTELGESLQTVFESLVHWSLAYSDTYRKQIQCAGK